MDVPPVGSSNKFAHYSHTNAKNEGIPRDAIVIQVVALLQFTRVGTAGFGCEAEGASPEASAAHPKDTEATIRSPQVNPRPPDAMPERSDGEDEHRRDTAREAGWLSGACSTP